MKADWNDLIRKTNEKSTIYHKGKKIELHENSKVDERNKELIELLNDIEEYNRNLVLFFDIDGTLMPAGIGTGKNDSKYSSINDFVEDNKDTIKQFKNNIVNLSSFGLKIGINTGRGMKFTKDFLEKIFPKNKVDFIIAEGGVAITTRLENIWSETTPGNSVNKKSSEILHKYRIKIESIISNLGGHLEGGKEIMVSGNPPKNQDIDIFRKKITKEISEMDILEHINITNSKTAVDISPKGADKLEMLRQVLDGKDYAIYFGDAPNDERAMKGAKIVGVPGNAASSTIDIAKKSLFGLISEKKDLEGTVENLKTIDIFWHWYKKQKKEGK